MFTTDPHAIRKAVLQNNNELRQKLFLEGRKIEGALKTTNQATSDSEKLIALGEAQAYVRLRYLLNPEVALDKLTQDIESLVKSHTRERAMS